jgi:hypothetical protein
LLSNSKTQLERVTKGKPSSLLGLVVGDEGKKFYNIETRWMLNETAEAEKYFQLVESAPIGYDVSISYPF